MDSTDQVDEYAAILGANLQRIRSGRSLTQTEVATRAGIARGHYSALEAGRGSGGGIANPRLSTLLHLANALEVTLSDVLDDIQPQALPTTN